MKLGELDILHHNAIVALEQAKEDTARIEEDTARIEREFARIERTLQIITVGLFVGWMIVVYKLCNS